MRIGILALQGAFLEHQQHFERLRSETGIRLETLLVKTEEDLNRVDALVIPGGESTVQLSLASRTPNMLQKLTERLQDPDFPVWGTCAGMILMAAEDGVGGGRIRGGMSVEGVRNKELGRGLGAIPSMKVWRNAYGSQLESFEIPLEFTGLSHPRHPFPAVFIRAPAIHSMTPESNNAQPIESLCRVSAHDSPQPPPEDNPFGPADPEWLRTVAVRQGKKFACSFHPELSKDLRVHEFFVNKVMTGAS